MWTKKYILIALFTTATFFGCNENSVAPSAARSDKISGETKLIKFMDLGTTKQLENGKKQIKNQVAVFEDECDCSKLSGVRNIVMNYTFDKDNYGTGSGTFSIETKDAYWEGNWTGTTNASGTTIRAVGYNFDERDQYCEWTYFFSSSKAGQSGIYSAQIFYNDQN